MCVLSNYVSLLIQRFEQEFICWCYKYWLDLSQISIVGTVEVARLLISDFLWMFCYDHVEDFGGWFWISQNQPS